MPNSTFIVGQVCSAGALQTGCRPRIPAGFAAQTMSGSIQIAGDPRRLSALSSAGQVCVPQVSLFGLHRHPGYHAGFTR
jgi:hypothetical protein